MEQDGKLETNEDGEVQLKQEEAKADVGEAKTEQAEDTKKDEGGTDSKEAEDDEGVKTTAKQGEVRPAPPHLGCTG